MIRALFDWTARGVLVAILAGIVGIYIKRYFDIIACDGYNTTMFSYELCTEAGPGKAICMVTPDHIEKYKVAVYETARMQCRAE